MNLASQWRGLRQRVLAATPSAWASIGGGSVDRVSSTNWRDDGELFQFPLAVPVRIALLDTGFREGPDVRSFALEDIVWLRAFAPEAVVLPLGLALSLADQKRRGLFALPSLNTAIVVVTSLDDSTLADHHRDMLWHAFGVPLFEQLLGRDGTVTARECEVHDGLHVDNPEAIHNADSGDLFPAGVTGEIVREPCDCGSESPRLRGLVSTRGRSATHARAG